MKDFSLYRHLLQVLVAMIGLALFSSHMHDCHAIKLNPNGGYDIVIGVEDNTPEPLNVNHFLDEIRLGMDQFSAELWKSTHRRFFINSVDVIVPANWWTLNKFHTTTWQTLLDSEIRISHDVGAPNVVNPNTCGTSGLYVELPDNFFKAPRGGQYGPIGKALVNLWARYRYGVWEEHGIPGDTQFPYFFVHPSFEPKWEATGCSNKEIDGTFRNIDGDISERCDPHGPESPDDDCRFIPSPSNTANSSLMNLHWMDSVSEFCDKKTHNYAAPNRQNLFCGHRSVWEVIRESDDYRSTKTCMDSVERPQFRVMKEDRSPELYILMDRGRTHTPVKVQQEVMGALLKLISTPSLERINIAIGTYPHSNQGRNHYYVREEIGWAPIGDVIYDVQRVLDESSNTDGPVIRDFGLAIQEVAEKIKQRNHLAGTVILVIKRGATPNFFDKISFEQEVIASIKEDSRIKVFAIETQQGEKTPYANLQTLTEETFGQYHLINDTVNTARKLDKILSHVQEKLEQASIMNLLSSWTTQKQYTDPDTSIEIPIYDNVNMIKVHLITNPQMVATDIYLEQLSGKSGSYSLSEKGEWDENSDLSRRIVFTYTITNPEPGSVWSLKHGCHTAKLSECRFFLMVTVDNNLPTPGISGTIFNSQSINIDVSTSAAEYSHVDMSHQGLKIVPMAIYAKIEMGQQRVLGLENVTALVRLGGEHNNHLGDWVVPLADDGLGLPDISEHDGIYSGIFTPAENGLYQISVAANGVSKPTGSTFQDIRIVNHAGGLMQVSQQSFGCKNSSKPRCASAVPRGSFSRVQDIRRTVAVENAATFKPGKPTKIMDFTVTTYPNYMLEFEFTSPRLLGSDANPEEFLIYMAPHVDNFIGSTHMTKLLISSIGEPSGNHIKIRFNAASKAIPFYAVEAMYGGQKGGPSNVVGVVPTEQGSIVPSPTTTTNLPPTTRISTVTTSTTEFPWPTTTPTTESPFPTTTDESEETDPFDPTSSTPQPSTTTVSTTPTSTNPTDPSSTTTLTPITTTEDSGGSSSTTTTPPTTTDNLSTTTDFSSTTTTQDPGVTSSSSTTTAVPSMTTPDPEVTSSTSTTAEPSTTTQDPGVTTSSSTTAVPSTTTPDPEVSSSTGATPTTTPDPVIPSSSTTTAVPSTTDAEVTSSSSSTTAEPSTTTSSSTTTDEPSTTTPDPVVTSSTSTTAEPSTTTQDPGVTNSSSSTTAGPSTTTPDPEVTSSTDATSTTTPDPVISSSSTTTAVPSTTDAEVTSSSSSTTEEPSTTTQDPGVTTSSSTTSVPSTTTPDPEVTSSTDATSTTTPDPGTSSSSTTTAVPSTSTTTKGPSSSSTTERTTSTPDEDNTNPPKISTTPEPSSSSLSTGEQASTQTTSSESSASINLAKSERFLSVLALILIHIQFHRLW